MVANGALDAMPALLTSTSMGPSRSVASDVARMTASRSVTSHTIGSAEPACPPDPIGSPTDWARGYFAASWGESILLIQRELDLDLDGEPELLLGNAHGQSKNGMPFAVFQRKSEGYRYLGELWCQRDFSNLRVLPPAGDGSIRLAQLWHMSAEEVGIAILGRDGTHFLPIESVMPPSIGTMTMSRRPMAA